MLGVVIRSDLSWGANTDYMVKRANSKLWCLRRLKKLGGNTSDLVDVFIKQIRSLLEFAVPVWHPGLTGLDRLRIERVQKSACSIILGHRYVSYRSALKQLGLETLYSRRNKLSTKFAKKAQKHSKFKQWFKPKNSVRLTRGKMENFCRVRFRTTRFQKSPLSFLTDILNKK